VGDYYLSDSKFIFTLSNWCSKVEEPEPSIYQKYFEIRA
jgi:hypothetical protein